VIAVSELKRPIFSVIIPAHNEEKYIGGCLRAIRRAASHVPEGGVQSSYLLKNRRLTKEIFMGKNKEAADSFYYDVR